MWWRFIQQSWSWLIWFLYINNFGSYYFVTNIPCIYIFLLQDLLKLSFSARNPIFDSYELFVAVSVVEILSKFTTFFPAYWRWSDPNVLPHSWNIKIFFNWLRPKIEEPEATWHVCTNTQTYLCRQCQW